MESKCTFCSTYTLIKFGIRFYKILRQFFRRSLPSKVPKMFLRIHVNFQVPTSFIGFWDVCSCSTGHAFYFSFHSTCAKTRILGLQFVCEFTPSLQHYSIQAVLQREKRGENYRLFVVTACKNMFHLYDIPHPLELFIILPAIDSILRLVYCLTSQNTHS